jgi:hypothetical protein
VVPALYDIRAKIFLFRVATTAARELGPTSTCRPDGLRFAVGTADELDEQAQGVSPRTSVWPSRGSAQPASMASTRPSPTDRRSRSPAIAAGSSRTRRWPPRGGRATAGGLARRMPMSPRPWRQRRSWRFATRTEFFGEGLVSVALVQSRRGAHRAPGSAGGAGRGTGGEAGLDRVGEGARRHRSGAPVLAGDLRVRLTVNL